MKDYVILLKHENPASLSVCFWIEQDRIMNIGDKLNKINELAYMNGYNWEAILKHYLQLNHPEITEGMGTDPEAGTYVAYYKPSPENEKKAEALVNVIKTLIENEHTLLEFVKKEGEKIEWD